MPEEQSSTPEKELLKFIEEEKATPALKVRSSVRQGKSFISIGGLRARFSFIRDSLKSFSFKKISVDIKTLNMFLMIVVFILGVSFLAEFIRSLVTVNSQVEAAFAGEQVVNEFQFPEMSSLKNSSYYLEKARKRDIFKIVTEKQIVAAAQVKAKPKEILTKTKDLKLVGIAWSDDPDAMIEDARSKRTFFLKRGDTVNDLTVQAIFRDRVVLTYHGEEIELK